MTDHAELVSELRTQARYQIMHNGLRNYIGETAHKAASAIEALMKERDQARSPLEDVAEQVFFAEQSLTHHADSAFAGKVQECGREFGRSVWGVFKNIRKSFSRNGVEVPELKIGDMEARRTDFISALDRLTAENERLRSALECIAESHDAGRHDGLPEPCPAHDATHMWAIARGALGESK